MSENQLNIKSSTIEKGLDLAKDFLGKLISPTVEEIGLLMSDNIKYVRFKNQVKILLKAQKYVESKNLTIKEIPIKILVPLLENASLEDSEDLQDKWAKMLTNMVDSETNLQNQIFPYLLSQISKGEFDALTEISEKEFVLKDKKIALSILKEDDKFMMKASTRKLNEEIMSMEQSGFWASIEEFEFANLTRLGLIKQLPPRIYIEEFQTNNQLSSGEQWHQISAEYDHEDYGYRMTDLGEKFLEICELKK